MAITNFHQELIPTELLFAIVASRESVPFPIVFELLIMEIAFELIREASIRVPNPIGPTLGIVRRSYIRTSCRTSKYCKSHINYYCFNHCNDFNRGFV